jgi:hypothetical protein
MISAVMVVDTVMMEVGTMATVMMVAIVDAVKINTEMTTVVMTVVTIVIVVTIEDGGVMTVEVASTGVTMGSAVMVVAVAVMIVACSRKEAVAVEGFPLGLLI